MIIGLMAAGCTSVNDHIAGLTAMAGVLL